MFIVGWVWVDGWVGGWACAWMEGGAIEAIQNMC